MNFNITKKNKKKARKNRIRKEKKWIIPRVVTTVLCIVSIVSFCVGIFVISNNDYEKLQIFGIIFVVTFIIAIILSTVVKNLASHWIQDRLNEKLWMDENALYHFQQVAFAAGLNSRNADSTGYAFVMPFSSIRNVKYDEKSRRIEFLADGKIAYTYITKEDEEKVHAESGDHEGIVEIGRDVEGVEVSIFIRQTEKGCKISLRSNEYVNVSDACVVFGGGGHPRAAGCTIQGTIEQAKEKVIKEVMRLL